MHRFTFLLLMISCSAASQSVSTRMGARASALGYSSFSLSDESSLFNNVAGMAWNTGSAAFFAHEITAVLPGANRIAAGIMLPCSFGTIGAGAFRFGDNLYSEQLVCAGVSHRLGSTSLGGKVNYVQYRADGFDVRAAVTLDVAGLTKLTPAWTVGAGIFNITQSSIAPDEVLPVLFVAAVGWQTQGGPLLTLEAEKQLNDPLRIKGGIEFAVYRKVFFRAGFTMNSPALSSGLGTKSRRIACDFSIVYRQVHGFFYHVSVAYRLGKITSS